MTVSPGSTMSLSFTFSSFFLRPHHADDADARGGAAVGDASGKRQRLQDAGVLLLQRIGAGVLDLAEHIDALRPRDEDRIAVAKHDVVGERAVLHRPQIDPFALRGGVLVRERRTGCALCRGARRSPRRWPWAASSRRAQSLRPGSCHRTADRCRAFAPRRRQTPSGSCRSRPTR